MHVFVTPGGDPNWGDFDQRTPLHTAAEEGNIAGVCCLTTFTTILSNKCMFALVVRVCVCVLVPAPALNSFVPPQRRASKSSLSVFCGSSIYASKLGCVGVGVGVGVSVDP